MSFPVWVKRGGERVTCAESGCHVIFHHTCDYKSGKIVVWQSPEDQEFTDRMTDRYDG